MFAEPHAAVRPQLADLTNFATLLKLRVPGFERPVILSALRVTANVPEASPILRAPEQIELC